MNALLVQQGQTCSCLIRALWKSRSSTWEPQRRDLFSSLTAEGHCPPGHVQTGFMRGLPAPRSVRNTHTTSVGIMVMFLEDSTEIQTTVEKSAFLENSL